jgi:hypothetical protein
MPYRDSVAYETGAFAILDEPISRLRRRMVDDTAFPTRPLWQADDRYPFAAPSANGRHLRI